ncbi:twin-arginine translocation signal domain-containing protein [Pseudomonas alkylphenolica]|uniref:twin-arginine translocation signal domain-containing protein n=1 Tax=Pseudomonas alkylphenolica TaxID=237609 RepID=UPI0033999FB3
MCKSCDSTSTSTPTDRRRFLKFAGLGAGALLLANALPERIIQAAEKSSAPPKPQNAINPDQALQRA